VFATALVDDGPDGDLARERMRGDADVHAPHLIDLEVASTFRKGVQRGDIDASRAMQALVDLADSRIRRYPHTSFLPRVWELRENLTVYDAAYVALAETLDAVLVTADQRIAGAAGVRCACEVLGR
jgi:predicted nucleic acid-binding protein